MRPLPPRQPGSVTKTETFHQQLSSKITFFCSDFLGSLVLLFQPIFPAARQFLSGGDARWRCLGSLQPCKDVHTRSHLHPAADVSNLYLYLYLYFQCIVLFINMCICIWSKQLYIYPQTAKQPCKDVHSRSSSILGQTSPNQLEFQTGLAFNLLPASAFSVQFFLDFEKIILENIQQSKKMKKEPRSKF